MKNDPAVLEYIAEGKEIIERVSKNLSLIEQGQHTAETLSSLYRDVHTLKGSSHLFGFKMMAQISHALEACLDPVRKDKMQITPRLVNACARNIDLLDRLLGTIENQGAEFDNDQEVVSLVSQLIDASTLADRSDFRLVKDALRAEDAKTAKIQNIPLHTEPQSIEIQPQQVENMSNNNSSSIQKAVQSTSSDASASAPTGGGSAQAPAAPVGDATIRVHVSLLDRILNLVGELVLVRNQLMQHRTKTEDNEFLSASKSLDVVTSDLQSEIMKTRMQPIETVVGKFQRMVRDIARDLGKKIDLTLEGSETELDKSLLEAIKDPLTHIVRNSCDHGIEFPDDRKKGNKPETGHILIRSFHEGGQVVIEVSDDGRGLNRQRIVQKAIEKGLMNAEKASKLTDREICAIIFLPGFSTAQQVTAVSGRGVGMDVVKTNVEKVGGSIEIKSVQDKGTSMQLRIPLTLAIVPALIIKSGKERFAIPQVKLVELVRVEARGHGNGATQIEYLQGRPMYRLRGNLLPLYDIREITGEPFDSKYEKGVFIIVLNSEGENFGLLVPEVLDTADIVVKPMSSMLNNLMAFSGATILGDGSIALIIDVGGVAQYGKVLNKRAHKDDRESYSKSERAKLTADIQEFLLFSVGTDARHALPLCLVQRLEEFAPSKIERSGEQEVVRYRGNLLPLINLGSVLKYKKTLNSEAPAVLDAAKAHSVIVVQRSGRSYGLVVDEIIDVLTIEGQIDDTVRDRRGILGNLVFNEEVVVVIDALGLIEDFTRALVGQKLSDEGARRDVMGELRDLNNEMKFKSVRVLYAEDVAFFRKHVSKVLAGAGIDVTTVEDGLKAIQEIDSCEPGRYNLILSDIEMPNMNGLDLVREIRKRDRYKDIPIVALTTRYREKDINDGIAAGFNRYLEKLNPDKLLAAINELMNAKGAPSKGAAKEGVM